MRSRFLSLLAIAVLACVLPIGDGIARTTWNNERRGIKILSAP